MESKNNRIKKKISFHGLRGLLICGMTREKLISFIKSKAEPFNGNLAENTTIELIRIAIELDKEEQEKKLKKRIINL